MKVLKNYLYNITYQIFVLLLPFITIPYISRVLGAHGVGINAYTASIMQYFILFASLGVNTYGNREIAYHQGDKLAISKLFYEIYILRVSLVIITYGIFLCFLFSVKEYQVYYLYQSIGLIAVAFDISWFFMGLEDFKKTVLRNLIVKCVSLVLIFTFVKNISDLGLYILILSSSTLLGNMTLFPYLRKMIYPIKQVGKLHPFSHLRSTFVMFIPQISISIYLVLNKTILGAFKGTTAVGYFENADKLIAMVIAVLTATKTVLMPRVANLHSNGQYEKTKDLLYKFFTFLNLLAIPATILLMIIGPNFSTWFFGKSFQPTGIALVLHAPTIIFVSWSTVIGQQYLLPLNRMKEYNQSIYYTALATVILDLIVVKPFGLYGIACISVVSEMLVAGIQLFYMRNDISYKRLFREVPKIFLASSIMGVIIYIVNSHLTFTWMSLILEGFIAGSTYFILLTILHVDSFIDIFEVMKKKIRRG